MKKILTIIIFFTLFLCELKAYDFQVNGIYYNKLSNDEVEVTYKKYGEASYSGTLNIPESVTYGNKTYKVTRIGESAFNYCVNLVGSLNIPNSVTSIGDFAFVKCSGLTGSLNISNSITKIGKGAFYNCRGFSGTLTISNSVTIIENSAFEGCSGFTGSLIIPNSVTSIGEAAFYDCIGFSGTLTLSNSVTTIGDSAFGLCSGFTGSLIIPNSVTSIGQYAFSRCNGFTGTLTIPNSVTSIGKGAFRECSSFTGSLIVPNSVTNIEDAVFAECRGLTGTLTIPNSVISIGDLAFYDCGLTGSLKIPNSIISIGEHAFAYCLGFTGSLTIPSSVTSIGREAFGSCGGFTELFIPNSVKSIGTYAFSNCTKLEQVKSEIVNPFSITEDVFRGISSNAVLQVPKGTKSSYQQFSGWTQHFKEILTFSENEIEVQFVNKEGKVVSDGATVNVEISEKDVFGDLLFKTGLFVTNASEDDVYVGIDYEIKSIPNGAFQICFPQNCIVNNAVGKYSTPQGVLAAGEKKDIQAEWIPNKNGFGTCTVIFKANVYNFNTFSKEYTLTKEGPSVTVNLIYKGDSDPTTHTLSVTASGNGSATYNGTTARNQTRTFTVNQGTSPTISFSPDNGYRIGSLLVNNTNVTSSVYNNQYTINNITANTTVSVTFEQIPQTTYTLSVTASGYGSATYNGTSARNQTRTFTVNQGTSATISFSPDNGYRIGSVLVNNTNVTSSVYNNQYTIGNITANTIVSVTFEQSITSLTYDGVKYRVISFDNKTVNMANGSYAQSITIPASFYSQGFTWTVVGIDNNALSNSPNLSAIIWNPNISFTASVSNPNLLLYVKASQYAPSAIKNVIVNNIASRITLTDAADGNDFYCPQEFTAQNISYTHTYGMTTGIDYAMGWESLALPFDVKNITHSSKGSLLPFAKWSSQANAKPFWLYELKASGFVAATNIKANTPYIISMPNNSQYDSNYNVNGTITFSSSNVVVKKSDNLNTAISGSKYLVPNFSNRASNVGFYALNVKNNYEQNNSSFRDGSIFVKNLRKIHPFEAYIWMSGNNAKESIPIFEDETTPIWLPEIPMNENTPEKVYNLNGQQVNSNEFRLPKGIYVIKGKKIVIK